MESSWKKPESKMVKGRPAPAPASAESEDARDNQEAIAAAQKRAQQEKENEDKIGKLLGANWFITNWTNPVLAHPILPQPSVARFYPDVFVAVDIFTYIGEWERKLIEFKREAFKTHEVEHGGKKGKVRYGALSYADPLAALGPQLED